MSIGFVYVLLNPAFPRQIKIGRSRVESQKRAKELSRQTGVPHDFIVLYDEMVGDNEEVERLMHERFADDRITRNKEFFYTKPKDAIRALREFATRFPANPSDPVLHADLMEYLSSRFSEYLDPNITDICLVQLPDICYLEVTRLAGKKKHTTREQPPLWDIETPATPTFAVLEANATKLKSLNEYDWIMIANLFPGDIAQRIADEWERPAGTVDKLRVNAEERRRTRKTSKEELDIP